MSTMGNNSGKRSKYQEETKNDDRRMIKSIREENMKLRQELKKLKQERDSFK